MIEKFYGLLSFNKLTQLRQVRLCSGRPQKCTVFDGLDPSTATDIDSAFEAKLIENKKVTSTLGGYCGYCHLVDDITWETSVQVS